MGLLVCLAARGDLDGGDKVGSGLAVLLSDRESDLTVLEIGNLGRSAHPGNSDDQ